MSLEKMIIQMDPFVKGCLPEHRLTWIYCHLQYDENDFYNYVVHCAMRVTDTASKEGKLLKKRDDEILEVVLMKHKEEIDSMSLMDVYQKIKRFMDIIWRTRPGDGIFHPMLLDPQARLDLFLCDELPAWTKKPVVSCHDGVYTCEELTDEDLKRLEEMKEAIFQRSGGWYNQTLETPDERAEGRRIFGKCKKLYPRKNL